MIDPHLVSIVALGAATCLSSIVAIRRGAVIAACRLRMDAMTVELRAREADAAELNRLLDRRADRIESQELTIGRLYDDKIALQRQLDEANDRVVRFEDADAARQAQRKAAAIRAGQVARERAAQRKAEKSGAGVAAKTRG